jgi:hypothetical protein
MPFMTNVTDKTIDSKGRSCTKCGVYKPYSEYSKKNSNFYRGIGLPHQVLQPRCKVCAAEDTKQWNLTQTPERKKDLYFRRIYGMGLDEFETRWEEQRGSCKICNRLLSRAPQTGDSVVVDHNHETGEIRGLLCNECNRGIGYLKDNPMLCLKAFRYLSGEETPEGGQ